MSKNLERKRERRQERVQQKQGISLDAIDRLTINELSTVRNHINRRFIALEGDTSLNQLTGPEGYNLGAANVAALLAIYRASQELVSLFNEIIRAFLGVQGLPEEYRLTQLRNVYSLFTYNMPLNKHLILAVDALRLTLKDSLPAAQSIMPDEMHVTDMNQLIGAALRLSDAIRLLMDTKHPDRGATLREWVHNDSYADIRDVVQYMLDNAKPFGRSEGTSPWKTWLREEWKILEIDNANPQTVRYLILKDIAEQSTNRKGWVLKDEYQTDQLRTAAFKSLTSDTAEKRIQQYRTNLFT